MSGGDDQTLPVADQQAGADSDSDDSTKRVSIIALARRVRLSPVSFHGRTRRLQMGLIDTPGPEGAYVTRDSAERYVARKIEVREARRANKQ